MKTLVAASLLAAALIPLFQPEARAQNSLQLQLPQTGANEFEIPQASGNQLQLPRSFVPRPNQQGNTPYEGEGQNTIQIPQVLREAVKGCWRGLFGRPDSFTQLNSLNVGGWLPVSYRLCFRWVEGGPLETTFAKAASNAAANLQRGVSDYEERVRVVAMRGSNEIVLHGDAIYYQTISSRTLMMTNTDQLRCTLVSDGFGLNVERSQLGRCNGAPDAGCNGSPWYRAIWHATFSREPAPSR